MLQLALTIIIFLIIVIPVGRYMYHIATWNHTLADPVFDRLDGVIYKIGGVNPHQGMNWRQYALALVGTNAVMVAIGYLILRIQSVGIFYPCLLYTSCCYSPGGWGSGSRAPPASDRGRSATPGPYRCP